MTEQYPKLEVPIGGQPVLKATGLQHRKAFSDISFCVHRGEILGLAGLTGSGKFELARSLYGSAKLMAGTIEMDGHHLPAGFGPHEAVEAGIAFLPADRKVEGLFLEHELKSNITISNLKRVIRGWIRADREKQVAEEYVRSLAIKTPSVFQVTRNLSGGNQQKVMIARWLFNKPKVLIFEEPTRGIDVNAKVEVYNLIGNFVQQGGAVIIVSSELPELEGICDRVLVMRQGAIASEIPRERICQEAIAYHCVVKTSEGTENGNRRR
jgi:ribose transport system ATP-binding protein